MKKSKPITIIIIVIILFLLMIVYVKNYKIYINGPYKTHYINNDNEHITIKIPKYSMLIKKGGEHIITFKTFTPQSKIKEHFESYLMDFEKMLSKETKEIIYYDSTNNLIIADYNIQDKKFINEFSILYYQDSNMSKYEPISEGE